MEPQGLLIGKTEDKESVSQPCDMRMTQLAVAGLQGRSRAQARELEKPWDYPDFSPQRPTSDFQPLGL